jgi:hypothetical protein
MSEEPVDRDDAKLAATLREALAMRDRATRPPRFTSLWPQSAYGRSSTLAWRSAFAALAAVLVVTGLSWTWMNRSAPPESSRQQGGAEASLARQLSSPDYWRVPTDELLAYAAPPLNADLPSPSGFEVSLEESLL